MDQLSEQNACARASGGGTSSAVVGAGVYPLARKDGVTVRLDSRSLTSLRSLGQWALALASQQVEVQGRSSTELMGTHPMLQCDHATAAAPFLNFWF